METKWIDARNPYSKGLYAITCPSGRVIDAPPKGAYWRFSEEKFKELDADGRIWWGKTGNSIPQLKRFLSEVKQGIVPQTLWTYSDVGHTQEAKQELVSLCDFEDSSSVFITPKPVRLVQRIIEIAADKDSLVLDSFAGSGTTGQAVLSMNAVDGGARRFILVEMEAAICRGVASQRLERVVTGHNDIPATGGGFRYCTLAPPLFDEQGNIREGVTFADLAAHVYFTETGEPIPKRPRRSPHPGPLPEGEGGGYSPLLGVHNGRAVCLLFNGVLGDKRPDGGNVLTSSVLASLPEPPSPRPSPRGRGSMVKVIYGEGCRLSAARLKRENIVFKQVPYGIKVT